MKVTIGNTTYTKLRSVDFAPQADVTGLTMPINEFEVQIMTENTPGTGQYAVLMDDLDNVWAKYWVTYAEHEEPGVLKVRAQSRLALLDRKRLGAALWSGQSTSAAITAVLSILGEGAYSFDPSDFDDVTLGGYVPEHTARERLQWLCLVLGAYVKTAFTDRVEVLPIPTDAGAVPMEHVFWRPRITDEDFVTEYTARAYSYSVKAQPESGERWYELPNGSYAVEEYADVSLAATGVPQDFPDNVMSVQDVTIIDENNADDVLSRLAAYYSNRRVVTLEALNDFQYAPGDFLVVPTGPESMMRGFVQSCSFTFGLRAKAQMVIGGVESLTGARLTVIYKYGGTQLGKRTYSLPAGYVYSIANQYIVWDMNGHRYVFRPLTEAVSGTMTAQGKVETVQYAVALDLHEGILDVVSVDEVEVAESTSTTGGTETTTRTAVIS